MSVFYPFVSILFLIISKHFFFFTDMIYHVQINKLKNV